MFKDIVIVGLGLIGGSIAGAVRKSWPDARIVGVDVDERTRGVALSKGLVDEALDADDARFADVLANECDLVVLATPVDVDEPYLKAIADSGYTGIVTDTASTKERLCAMASQT